MNEVMNAILTRRSIRKFTDAPIPRDILEELVNAGLQKILDARGAYYDSVNG